MYRHPTSDLIGLRQVLRTYISTRLQGRRVYTWVLEENGKRLKVAKMPHLPGVRIAAPDHMIDLTLIDQDLPAATLLYRVTRTVVTSFGRQSF